MISELVEIAVRNMMVLAGNHPAKAAEIALHHVGMLAVPVAVAFRVVEALAANLLKAELKRKGVIYSQHIEKLNAMGVDEKEVNVRNKLSRGKFTAAFLLQCLTAIGSQPLHLA